MYACYNSIMMKNKHSQKQKWLHDYCMGVLLGCVFLFLGLFIVKSAENAASLRQKSEQIACQPPAEMVTKEGCRIVCAKTERGCGPCRQHCTEQKLRANIAGIKRGEKDRGRAGQERIRGRIEQ